MLTLSSSNIHIKGYANNTNQVHTAPKGNLNILKTLITVQWKERTYFGNKENISVIII